MTTLRAKLAVLIAVVIITMVTVLTGVLFRIFNPPNEQQAVGPLVEQVQLLVQVVRTGSDAIAVQQGPAEGKVAEGITTWLREALETRGMPRDVVVSYRNADDAMMLSVPVERGWLVMQITDFPPRIGVLNILLMWFALIAFGAIAIALLFAERMVKPLVLLERAIESVGPDALLPELAVKGPAEVRVAARALNGLSSRLKAAMESRMRLVAAAGHDLRTPITRMRLRAEFVKDDDERSMWLKDIEELGRIADSAILLVREESGRSPSEELRLDVLIAELAIELKALSYDVTLTATAAATVRASHGSLKRAFGNLIINAATHGRRARVSLETVSSEAVVVIDDDGPGIQQELIGQVFEPFFRVHPSREKDSQGAGLGLTIASEIVQRCGGSITIRNGALQGLLQVVRLPMVETLPRTEAA